MHSLIFSQVLTPQVQTFDKDTLFCFSIAQSKLLAGYVLKSEYSDSLILHLERQNKLLDSLLIEREDQAELLEKKMRNLESILVKQQSKYMLLDKRFLLEQKHTRKLRVITIILGTGLVVLTGIILIN